MCQSQSLHIYWINVSIHILVRILKSDTGEFNIFSLKMITLIDNAVIKIHKYNIGTLNDTLMYQVKGYSIRCNVYKVPTMDVGSIFVLDSRKTD